MVSDLMQLGKKAIQKALKLGADQAEVYILNSRDFNIQVARQNVDTIKLAEERGLGIRVFKEKRMGFSFTSDLGETAVEQVIYQAIDNSLFTGQDENLLWLLQ